MDHPLPPDAGLMCRGLTKQYKNIEVLKSVNLSLRPGQVVGLIGENGAGKSTFNAIIAGVVRPTAGQMWIDGQEYAPHSPSDAIARGVALIHQEIRLLPGLSVAENIFLGRLPMRYGRVDRASMEEQTAVVLAALGVKATPRQPVQGLSMAVQQGIEIAKAILRKPRFVIFDEPTASLGETEAEQIFEQVRLLQQGGAGVIYVSHRLDEVQKIADHVMCLRDGSLVAEWDRMPVSKEQMINAMVGREFTFEHHAPKAHMYRAILEGLAFEQRLSTMGAEQVTGARTERFLVMGGGSRSALWCQIIADILGRPVEIAREAEATCLGAGILAAVGAGHYDSATTAAAAMSGVGRGYAPDPVQSEKYDQLFDIYKDIYPALRDQFTRLRQVTEAIGPADMRR